MSDTNQENTNGENAPVNTENNTPETTTPGNDSPEVQPEGDTPDTAEVPTKTPADQMAPATPSNTDAEGKFTNFAWYQFPNESVGEQKGGYFRVIKDELYFSPLLEGQEKEAVRNSSKERKLSPSDLREGVYDAIRENLYTRY